MAKQHLPKIVSPIGIASYPHLTTPDEYKGKREYKTNLILDPAEAGVAEFLAKIEAACKKAYEEGIEALKESLPELKGKRIAEVKKAIEEIEVKLPFEPQYADDGSETGRTVVKFKALAGGVYQSGKNKGQKWERNLPIFDSQKNLLDSKSLRLWGGSTIRVQAEMQPYCMEGTGMAGVSLRLYSVQVIELATGGGDAGDGFGVEDGYVGSPKSASSDDDQTSDAPEADEDF